MAGFVDETEFLVYADDEVLRDSLVPCELLQSAQCLRFFATRAVDIPRPVEIALGLRIQHKLDVKEMSELLYF